MRSLAATLLMLASLAVAPAAASPVARTLVVGALAQVGVTVGYDGRYRSLSYPGGDVPATTGVCTDVVVRAYRKAGIDLQVEVHEDMRRAFRDYPRLWGHAGPDRSIDHRRVPNLATFFRRRGGALPVSNRPGDYLPGDVVTWRLPSGVPHIGVVVDRSAGGRPLVVHNIGQGARAEDVLFAYELTGHYRYPARR